MCVTGAPTIAIVVVRERNDEEPGSETHVYHEVTGSFEFSPSTLHPLSDLADGAAADANILRASDRVVNLDERDVSATADTVGLTSAATMSLSPTFWPVRHASTAVVSPIFLAASDRSMQTSYLLRSGKISCHMKAKLCLLLRRPTC